MVSQAIVCQFLYMVVVNDLLMSEKGVTVGRMFLYEVSIEIASYYRCRWSLLYVLKGTLMQI